MPDVALVLIFANPLVLLFLLYDDDGLVFVATTVALRSNANFSEREALEDILQVSWGSNCWARLSFVRG